MKNESFRIVIHLLDENDHYPTIDYYPADLPFQANRLRISVSEFLPINSLLLSFSVLDRDSDENGRVAWTMDPPVGLPFELLRLTENAGELRSTQLLDREHVQEYDLAIRAYDHGQPAPKFTQLHVRILILDENDHKPIFREENIRATISEHVTVDGERGYEVYRLQADDADAGLNGEVVLSLVNNEHRFFQIDERSGTIRAMKPFDRKQQDTYLVRVRADDRGIRSSNHAHHSKSILPSSRFAIALV